MIKAYEKLVRQDLIIEEMLEGIIYLLEDGEKEQRIDLREYSKLIEELKKDYEFSSISKKESKANILVAITLAAESGLKPSEIILLEKSNLFNGYIKVTSNNRQRNVPSPSKIDQNLIKKIIPFNRGVRMLQKGIKAAGEKILNKKVNFQTLRGCFVLKLQREGLPAKEIKKRLGLEDLGSLENYLIK